MAIEKSIYEPKVLVDTDTLTNRDWLQYRKNGIGGSDAAAIMGVSPFSTARDLFYDKKSITSMHQQEEENWVAKEVGNLLEELVAEIFCKITGFEVYKVHKMFQHPMYPFLLADVDYFISLPDGRTGILECKTCNYNARNKWADGGIPINYEYQVRHYQAVMNIDIAYIACLYGNNENEFVFRKIDRDFDEEENLIAQECYFWEEYIKKGIEPPYTEQPDLVLKSLKKHIGKLDQELPEIILSEKEMVTLEKYLALSEQKSQIEVQKKRIETEQKHMSVPFIEKLGRSCKATLAHDGKKYTITQNPTYRKVIKKEGLVRMQNFYPEIYAEFVSETENRVFRVKKENIL